MAKTNHPAKEHTQHIEWSELIGALDVELVVMRNGEPVAVLIPHTAYLAREEQIELLEDELAIARGEETVTDIDPNTFLNEILGDAAPA